MLFAVLLLQTPLQAATYKIDADHSSVTFKIRHLFSKVQGTFREYQGTLDYEPGKPETWKTEAAIQTASIDTGVKERDTHLRSADFFDADKYPTITFKSADITDATAEGAKLNGVLNMHGVEKPVALDLEIHGEGTDPWGNVRAGFTATCKVNRKDFGIVWNEKLETGQVLLGEDVEITLEIEAIKQGAAGKAEVEKQEEQ